MSASISIEEAQAKLPEIIGSLAPGEEVIITEGNQPIAELRNVRSSAVKPRFGNCRGMLTIIENDDEHLDDFKEYMP